MLKKYIALTGVAFLAATSLAFAEDLTNAGNLTNAEGKVKIGTDATATTYFEFQTSPQIEMGGESAEKTFVVGAVHTSAVQKKGGTAYAMSSETSGMYSLDLSGSDAKFAAPTLEDGAIGGDWAVEGSK